MSKEKIVALASKYLKARHRSYLSALESVYKSYQETSVSQTLQDYSRFVGRTLYNVHFDLPKHYEDRLRSSKKDINEEKTIADEIMLSVIGEAKWVRQTLDYPSQVVNEQIKKRVLHPFSDSVLSLLSNNSESVITHTPELVRKDLRFGLRRMSAANALLTVERREQLANSHCKGIVDEMNKILKTNVKNFFLGSEFSDEYVESILSRIPKVGKATKTFDQLLLDDLVLDDLMGDMRFSIRFSNVDKKEMNDRAERIIGLYKEQSNSVVEKLKIFSEEIEAVSRLEEEFGSSSVMSEYAKVRVLYASEWIARVMLLDGIAAPLVSAISEMNSEKSEIGVYSTNIFVKQVMTTFMGHSFNLYQKHKDRSGQGYIVAFDTEFHDYPKFLMRIAALGLLVMAQDVLSVSEEEVVEKEPLSEIDKGLILSSGDEKQVVKSISRAISGSHIAARMELVEKLLRPLGAFLSEIDIQDVFNDIKESVKDSIYEAMNIADIELIKEEYMVDLEEHIKEHTPSPQVDMSSEATTLQNNKAMKGKAA